MNRFGRNGSFFDHLRRHSGRVTEGPAPCQHCGESGCPCGQEEAQAAVAEAKALPLPSGNRYADKLAGDFTKAIPAAGTFTRNSLYNLRAMVNELAAHHRLGSRRAEMEEAERVAALVTKAIDALP